MKKIILIFLLTLSFNTYSQIKKTPSQNCFKNIYIEPSFIAFSTTKGSDLGNWYQKVFNLETVKEFAFPDGSVTGKLLRKKDFVVELFFREKIYDPKKYVQKSTSEEWKGVMKFGIYTNANLTSLKKCLKENNVNAGRIFNDKNLGIDLLYVKDQEGN
jgi:hypothetical protein